MHVLAWPYKHLHLDGKAFQERVEYAQLLNDASEIPMKMDEWHARQLNQDEKGIVLSLPQNRPPVAVPVVELFLNETLPFHSACADFV